MINSFAEEDNNLNLSAVFPFCRLLLGQEQTRAQISLASGAKLQQRETKTPADLCPLRLCSFGASFQPWVLVWKESSPSVQPTDVLVLMQKN